MAHSPVCRSFERAIARYPALQSRAGVRLNTAINESPLRFEFFARIVDEQDRVARSLLKSETSGCTTFDLRSFWQVSEDLSVIAGIAP